MFRLRHPLTVRPVRHCLLVLLLLGPPASVHGASQLLFDPLPLDALDLGLAGAVRLDLDRVDLGGNGWAERYRLRSWIAVGGRNAVLLTLQYVGREDGQLFRYGGGAPRVQWTTHLTDPTHGGLALDVGTGLPMGDRTLYPLSSRAPDLIGRLRWSPLGGIRWRAWLGVWGRRVSPPDERDRPLADFPSGTGVVLALHGTFRRSVWEAWVRQDTGGLPASTWMQLKGDVPVASDLSLRVGAVVVAGRRQTRPLTWGWSVGVVWRPQPSAGATAPP